MAGEWVTAGAPLESGDGWRIWYSWPTGAVHARDAAVRTPAGQDMPVTAGPWQPAPPVKGSARQMSVRELRIQNATPGELYEVTIPERGRPLYWRTLPAAIPDAGLSLLIGSCFWINDDRDGFYSAAVQELVQRERLAFKVLMGDQLYVDVWAPKPLKDLRKGLAQKYERYWGDGRLPGAARGVPEPTSAATTTSSGTTSPSRRSRSRTAGTATRRRTGIALHRALRRLPGIAQPRRQALDVVPRHADLVLHRRHALEPHPRQATRSAALATEPQWQDLEDWAAGLDGPGVLVLPQPLLKAGGSQDRPHAASTSRSPTGWRRSSNARSAARPPTASRTTS